MTVAWLLSDNLMTMSHVLGAARETGTELHVCQDFIALSEALPQETSDEQPLVLLDLQTRGVAWESAIAELQGRARLIAFGPHVWAEALAAARRAGCEEVLSNGEFMQNPMRWLESERG